MFSIQQLSIVKWNKNEIERPRCQRSCFELTLTGSKCHTEMTLLKWLDCDNDIIAILSQPLTLPTAFEVSTPKSCLLRATPNSSSPPKFSDVDSSSHMDWIWRRESLARSGAQELVSLSLLSNSLVNGRMGMTQRGCATKIGKNWNHSGLMS